MKNEFLRVIEDGEVIIETEGKKLHNLPISYSLKIVEEFSPILVREVLKKDDLETYEKIVAEAYNIEQKYDYVKILQDKIKTKLEKLSYVKDSIEEAFLMTRNPSLYPHELKENEKDLYEQISTMYMADALKEIDTHVGIESFKTMSEKTLDSVKRLAFKQIVASVLGRDPSMDEDYVEEFIPKNHKMAELLKNKKTLIIYFSINNGEVKIPKNYNIINTITGEPLSVDNHYQFEDVVEVPVLFKDNERIIAFPLNYGIIETSAGGDKKEITLNEILEKGSRGKVPVMEDVPQLILRVKSVIKKLAESNNDMYKKVFEELRGN